MLLALVGVNSVLAWHQAAHAFEQLTIASSSHPTQTAAQLDDHCGLCLSAHGVNGAPASQLPQVSPGQTPHLWLTPTPLAVSVAANWRPQARAPPVSVSI